jgi:hypothetical protein
MIRVVLALFGSLFFGGVGAFFLFVPPLLIAAVWIALVALLMAGFLLLDCFGFHAELQPVPPSDHLDRKH